MAQPIWLEIIEKEKQLRTGTLDLGNCGLPEIPTGVFDMIWVEVLIFSSYYFRWNDSMNKVELGSSGNSGKANKIAAIPEGINRLVNLRELYISGEITQIENIDRLVYLEQLDLGSNRISKIENLSGLDNLKLLGLDGNSINRIENIGNLLNLKALSLDYNQISVVENLDTLVDLRWLSVSNNTIHSIGALEQFKHLKQLDLTGNVLYSVEGFPFLQSLKRISFEENLIRDFSPLRDYVKNGLSFTLKGFNPFPSIDEITGVYLKDNPLVSPPAEVIYGGHDTVLRYFESIDQAQKEVLSDFKSKEVKLILLGNSNVGKTYLATYFKSGLKKLPPRSVSTNGLSIEKFEYKYISKKGERITVRLFDFGGQEYYHDTHHLFFTEDTVCFLLWEADTNRFGTTKTLRYQSWSDDAKMVEEENFNFPVAYWLDEMSYIMKSRSINFLGTGGSFSGDESVSLGRNLILVETKRKKSGWGFINTDEFKSYESLIHSLASLQLKEESGVIVDTGINNLLENFEEVCDKLVEKKWSAYFGFIADFFGKLHMPGKLPGSVLDILQQAGIQDKLLVSLKDCELLFDLVLKSNHTAYTFSGTGQGEDVCRFLSNRGYIIYHSNEQICLYPQKLTNKIYEILSKRDGGFIKKADIEQRAGKGADIILDFMQKYNLLISHPAKKDLFIAPQNLPEQPDETIRLFLNSFQPDNLRYRLLGYIHKGTVLEIFNSFKNSLVKDMSNNYFWKNGFVVKIETGKYNDLVKIEFEQNEKGRNINISKLKQGTDFSIFEEIELKVEAVLLRHNYEKLVSIDGKEFVGYNIVKSNADKQNFFFVLDDKQYRIADYKTFLRGKTRDYFMKKLFISYSSEDSNFMKRFETHLQPLKREGLIDFWHDRMIEPGTRWDDEIKKQMDESDIIVFLLSPDFIATSYIFEVEIPKALERQKNNQAKLFMVQLKPCRWKGTELGDIQLPLEPIKENEKEIINVASFDNDEAWYKVIAALESKIAAKP